MEAGRQVLVNGKPDRHGKFVIHVSVFKNRTFHSHGTRYPQTRVLNQQHRELPEAESAFENVEALAYREADQPLLRRLAS